MADRHAASTGSDRFVTALTVKDVAGVLAVGEATVRRLVRAGQITHVHAGNRIRVGHAQLEAFMAGEKSEQVCARCRPGAAVAQRRRAS